MNQNMETIDKLVVRQDKREITEIIVHSSATPEGAHFTVEDIDRWHRRRKFHCIGYHYVVYLDGSIHPGRPVEEMGAHCPANRHNYHSIGVCYIGGTEKDGHTPKDTRTPAQKEALRALLGLLKAAYRNARIYGHRDFMPTACPSFDARSEYKEISAPPLTLPVREGVVTNQEQKP